jgi:hypothetical protein
MFVNPDMSTVREAYGKEGLASRTGDQGPRIRLGVVVAIATSRDHHQAGKLITVELGKAEVEAHATDLTPQVSGNGCRSTASAATGPVGDVMKPSFLIAGPTAWCRARSWPGRPQPGLRDYLFDNGKRYPLYNTRTWEVSPIAISPAGAAHGFWRTPTSWARSTSTRPLGAITRAA